MGTMLLEAGVSNVSSAMDTAFKGMSGDIVGGIATVAPYALAVLGAVLVWKYGKNFFKSLGH